MTLSEKILHLRTARGLSQGELAEKLEVSRQSVSKWETGQSTPDLDKIIKLADLFGVTVDELVREGEKAEAPEPELREPRVIYVEQSREEEQIPKERGWIFTGVMLLYWMIPGMIFAFSLAGEIRNDMAALLLIFALCLCGVEIIFCRRHPWATILWTLVGVLPFWIILTGRGIDRNFRYLMIVIGLTAAAFGLFLTYRKK